MVPLRVLVVSLLLASIAWAVKPAHWTHTTEADFAQGTFRHVVATNLGDLKLSRPIKTLLGQDPRISAVYAMAQAPDGTIYAATGPEGVLLAIKDEKVSTVAKIDGQSNLVSLLVDAKGRLLIGTTGERGEVFRIDKPGDKPVSIFSYEGVQYIWCMLQTPDGRTYLGTGPNGQLFCIEPDGTSRVVLDSEENNLLALATDGKDTLFVGTDPGGLVLRVNRESGEMFVLYDAPESEIVSIVRDAAGNLYAATAQQIAPAGAAEEEAATQIGRPEGESHGVPITAEEPDVPKPPDVPSPAPGEPLPIPRQTEPKSLLILADAEASPTTEQAPGQAPPPPQPPIGGTDTEPPPDGNAIYQIDADGFVSEIFREQVTVYSLIEQNGSLLVATGSEGAIYIVTPAAEETAKLAVVDSRAALCLLPAKDGRIYLGLANSGEIAAMGNGFADEGSYTSPVLDATQISRFGTARLLGTLPAGCSLTIATRSGNIEEASAPGWSAWSKPTPASEFVRIDSPAGRFFQYRLTFTADGGKDSPVVSDVDVAYQTPNRPPKVASVTTAYGEDDEDGNPSSTLTVSWIATDPNEDDLRYAVWARNSTTAPWILLKDDLKDQTYDWNTRGAADGRYQLRVVATDGPANAAGEGRTASRVSNAVIVDNSPPVIGDASTAVAGRDVTVNARVVDRGSTVAQLEYSVNSADHWQTVLPSDTIADSPEEAYRFVASGLKPGAHQITLRATDSRRNRAFETLNVTIEAAK